MTPPATPTPTRLSWVSIGVGVLSLAASLWSIDLVFRHRRV